MLVAPLLLGSNFWRQPSDAEHPATGSRLFCDFDVFEILRFWLKYPSLFSTTDEAVKKSQNACLIPVGPMRGARMLKAVIENSIIFIKLKLFLVQV